MELLKATVRRKSLLSEALYVVLNIALAVVLLVIVLTVGSPWLALGLVLLSKWRIFAVRARYWGANIRANLIDVIVGFSIVVFLYAAAGSLSSQIGLTVLYVGWLLLIKPRSSKMFVSLQALIGIIFGIGAIIQLSYSWPASLVVGLAWLVGYSAARHVLSVHHETHINFLSLLWGFVVAELAWVTYHWTIGYDMPGSIQLGQATIVIAALSFLAERTYSSFKRNGVVSSQDIALPALLSLSIILVVVFFFGGAVTI